MTKREFEERLERLGPGPVGPDLGPQVLYLRKKVNILTHYLLNQTRLPSGRFAPRQSAAEETPRGSDAEEATQ